MEMGGPSADRSYSRAGIKRFFSPDLLGAACPLTKLVLYEEAAIPELWSQFTDALLALAHHGTLSQLEEIVVGNDRLRIDRLDKLTPVFAAGGLPRLVHLEVTGNQMGSQEANFPEAWAALGPKVRLEGLTLVPVMPLDLFVRILKAIEGEMDFCPSLRRMFAAGDNNYVKSLKDALETRQVRRELIAVGAGGDMTMAELQARWKEAAEPMMRGLEWLRQRPLLLERVRQLNGLDYM